MSGLSVHETTHPLRDPLTGLPARALLLEHAGAAVARARATDRHVALLHAGLDRLDLVAAGLGRDAYEEVIREVAARVRETLPDTAIVASVADGEVAVLLTDVRGDPASLVETVAGQVIEAAGRPLDVEGEQFELTARGRARRAAPALPADLPPAQRRGRGRRGAAALARP